MAQLEKESLHKLAQLSRIHFTQEEEKSLLSDLQKILSYVDQLQEVDTENVSPCNHVLSGMNNVMREDVVKETMPREVFLANAPEHTGGMIRVPPVIKKRK